MTLSELVDRACARLGGRQAMYDKLAVSRQRVHSAIRGGPPLHFERLLRLAIAAGVDPSEALRVGGRESTADLIEEAYGPLLDGASLYQRVLLHELDHFPPEVHRATVDFLRQIADARELAQPACSERPGDIPLPSQCTAAASSFVGAQPCPTHDDSE